MAWRVKGQAGRRTAEHDGQMSDSHGKGQVAQAARWLATLKASGCLRLLDGGENPHGHFLSLRWQNRSGKVTRIILENSGERRESKRHAGFRKSNVKKHNNTYLRSFGYGLAAKPRIFLGPKTVSSRAPIGRGLALLLGRALRGARSRGALSSRPYCSGTGFRKKQK